MFKTAGKLTHFFVVDDQFHMLKGDNDLIPFDAFYEVLLKWCLNQDKMVYDDFSLYEEQNQREEDLEAFKKMTDRIL